MKPEQLRIVMIATGAHFEAMAQLTHPRAERALGTSIELITDVADPFEAKLGLLDDVPDGHHVMLLDVDLVFFSWNWDLVKPGSFTGVADMLHPSWPGTKAITELMPYPEELTFNTGLWIAPGSFQPIFHCALGMARNELKDFQYRLWDQTPLNFALQQFRAPRHYLPTTFNWQISPKDHLDPAPPRGTHVVHLIEGGNRPEQKLQRVADYCKRFPYPS